MIRRRRIHLPPVLCAVAVALAVMPAAAIAADVPTIAPATVIGASATFVFSSSPAAASFECALDEGALEACASPQAYTGITEGPHTFRVRAIDADPLVPPSEEATQPFAVADATPPDTVIDAAPTAAAPAFSFSSEAGATFECRIDEGPFAACASPRAVPEGAHTFAVRAIDAAGNVDATPASQAYTLDGTAPETAIVTAPTAASPAFTFSSEAGATFECRVDQGAFAACTSPRVVPEGTHTFAVRAIDAAGNTDATPAFQVYTLSLRTSIDTGPSSTTNSRSVIFTFSSADPTATFECMLDGGPWIGCDSPHTYTGLAEGDHRFAVRVRDLTRAFDPEQATRAFTVDSAAPDTTIESGPSGTTSSASPTFTFASTEAGSSFQCRLDGGAWEPCATPRAYAGLNDGAHTFAVRATDAAGNLDGSEATRGFRVDTSVATTATAGRPPVRIDPPSPAGRRRLVPGPAVVISSRNRTLKASSSGVIAFSIGPVRERVSGVVSLKTDGSVTIPGASRKAVLALGSRLVQAAKGKRAVARIQLTARGRATLARNRTLKLKATVTLRDAAGNSTTRVYRFTVRAG